VNLRNFLLGFLFGFSFVVYGCVHKSDSAAPRNEEGRQVSKKAELFTYCADHQYCKDLREYEEKCRKKGKKSDCRKFTDNFDRLAVRNNCKREFDEDPVPSIWICDEDREETSDPKLFERSANTLSKSKFPFSIKLYGSDKFREILDGEVAEQHYQKSLSVGRQIK
jgi:hypothetical protein